MTGAPLRNEAMDTAPRVPCFVNPVTGLSADYLNSVVGFAMLLDLVPDDPGALGELAAWRRVGYRAHYEASNLSQAREAIACWDALPPRERAAFDGLVDAVDHLARAAVTALTRARPGERPKLARLAGAALAVLVGELRRAIEGGAMNPERARRIAQHGCARLTEGLGRAA